MPALNCLLAAGAGCAVGGLAFIKPLWFISVGYGAAMTLQSGLAYLKHRKTLDGFGKAHLALVGLYGARLVAFLLWRDRLSAYAALKKKHEAHAAGISPGKRAFMWAGCSLLYWAMFAPALHSARPGPKAAPGSPLYLLSAAALAFSGAALAWEAWADMTQQRYYQSGGARPCRKGPWALDHQANYHGEIGFWVGGYLAGLQAYPTPLDAVYASIGAAGIVWIVTHEGTSREKRQATIAKKGEGNEPAVDGGKKEEGGSRAAGETDA